MLNVNSIRIESPRLELNDLFEDIFIQRDGDKLYVYSRDILLFTIYLK